ncbi:MAG: HAMP domain-containing histidine kinase [Kiritimatiellae bacterium]|nr:HAMP domain-containing histidine kinase [Kiritimatiellia bacterium]
MTGAAFLKGRLEAVLLAALLVIALAAGGVLILLRVRHDQAVHISATASVLESGEALLDVLCASGLEMATNPPAATQWRAFSSQVESIFAVRKDVQSISVSRDGVTVFQRQAERLDGEAAADAGTAEAAQDERAISRGWLEIGGKPQPVFILSRTRVLPDGSRVVTEATVKREAVSREERRARRAMASLSTFSLIVLSGSFILCAAVLSFAILRDRKREARARQEEHLAFSGVLANGILHDFRNPMSAVRLDAQMLEREMRRQEGFRPARVEELAERVARTMGRMDTVFREFLFLAKPADERPESVDLVTAVRECLDTLGPRLEQAGVTAVFTPPEETVLADAYSAAFRRALMNVLVNATQFAPKGSAITVTLARAAGEVLLDVHNDGAVIRPKMREKIFEMFVTGRPEGTGLGLFLARTAIERCGGTLRALDVPQGATFRFELKEGEWEERSVVSGRSTLNVRDGEKA